MDPRGRRDANGNETVLEYNSAGNLVRISAGEGRWIALAYDRARRIVEARDSHGRTVKYEYDKDGHLIRVARADVIIQEYAYGPRNEVRLIREPDREILNTYDEALRCVKQIITFGARGEPPRPDPDVFQFTYRLNREGKIVQTRIVQPTGKVRVTTFNVNGYLVTDTTDAGGPHFSEVIYARDDRTNLADRVTIKCASRGQLVEAYAAVGQFEHPDNVRARLLAQNCR